MKRVFMGRLTVLLSAVLIVSLGSIARADLVITEVMSSSQHPGGPGNGDWFELHNKGGVAIDLTGYYWDDNGPNGNDGAIFPAISLGAGDTIVIVNEDAADLSTFVAAWGGGFTAISKDDFGGPDNFSGLSSNGDQIEIWDTDPNVGPANLVASVIFGAADGTGSTFEWFRDGTADGFSVAGEFGAYVAPGDGIGGVGTDVGSPGLTAIPEPGSVSLLALFLIGLTNVRRRK